MLLGSNAANLSSEGLEDNVLALLSGSRWEQSFVTYSFPDARSDYALSDTSADGFVAANSFLQNAVRSILEGNGRADLPGYMSVTAVEQFTNINVLFAGQDASGISFAQNSQASRSYANYPASGAGGDVWLQGNINYADVGSYAYYTILHELGHALGLKHGHAPAASSTMTPCCRRTGTRSNSP